MVALSVVEVYLSRVAVGSETAAASWELALAVPVPNCHWAFAPPVPVALPPHSAGCTVGH